jgi:hypothetical protein
MSTMPDITRREFFVMLPLIIVSFILGIYPNIVLESLHLGISSLLINVNTPQDIIYNLLPVFILLNADKKAQSKDLPDKPGLNKKEIFVPVIEYNNAEMDKSQILKDNKDKAGVYL